MCGGESVPKCINLAVEDMLSAKVVRQNEFMKNVHLVTVPMWFDLFISLTRELT